MKQEKGKQSQEGSDKGLIEPGSTNDPEWYGQDPALLNDAGQIPFSDVLGTKLNLFGKRRDYDVGGGNTFELTSGLLANTEMTIPGICSLFVRPTFGNNEDRNDPANVAATALYTHVRYNNSGRKNYDQADLFIYCMAASDLYSYINWLIRIYNCAFVYSQRNQYVGKALLEAQGVDPNDIIRDLPGFRYWINVFINKVASYAVPGDITLFKKRAFMYSAIYTESLTGSIKDQMYMYVPKAFYRFDLDSRAYTGQLSLIYPHDDNTFAKDANSGLLTTKGLEQVGDALLEYMWGDEDFGIMSGDILRAFEGNIVTLSQVGPEGGILPVYDAYVLHQMKNSRMVGDSWHVYNSSYTYIHNSESATGTLSQRCRPGCVYQDAKGNVVVHNLLCVRSDEPDFDPESDPTNQAPAVLNLNSQVVISVDSPTVDPALVVEITRNIAFLNDKCFPLYVGASDTADPTYMFIEYDSGDITIEYIRIHNKPKHNLGFGFDDFSFKIERNMVNDTFNDSQTADMGLAMSDVKYQTLGNFHYAPLMFKGLFNFEAHKMYTDVLIALSDMQNYTVQDPEVIQRLHVMSMLSLLYVPGVAKSVNYMK